MTAQILAAVIFVGMFALIIMDKFERQYVTLGSAALVLVVVFGICMHSWDAIKNALNLGAFFRTDFWYGASESASSGVNWSTIFFITGMMIMVEGLGKSGFFRWLCLSLAKATHYHVVPLLVCFMAMAAFLAMFIDSITVVLFLATVTLELAQILRFDPVPMILSEVFCANLGGAATMCGDPPNIIIGTSLGYSFTDFLTNTGVIAGVSLIVVVLYFYLVFHKELRASEAAAAGSSQTYPDPSEAITDKKGFIVSTVIFLCAVVLLVTHAQTGLTVSCIGVFISIVTLIAAGRDALKLIKQIDYKTLLFFIGLFMVVGGLEQTGILKVMANFIGDISNGNLLLMIAIILWISAIASAFVDNIPFAATMIPIISSLSATQSVDLSILAWALAMGTDIGGSATPIGASANVVGIATAAKAGHMIKWGKYCKVMAPATIIVIVISMVMIYARYL